MRIDNSLARYVDSIRSSEEQSKKTNAAGPSFEEVFNDKLQTGSLVFSKHAEQRLSQREITLSDSDIERLGTAVRRAEEKGVRNTLVLMDNRAFIVNVPNNTVITAIGENDLKDNVFTQIDGAVIV